MIYPKKNPLLFLIIHYYVKWIVSRHFNEVLFNDIEVNKNKSILLIANHYSFWDALILYVVNNRLFKKKFHVMVLEETLKKERFLKYNGAFSINKNSRDILVSLDFAAKLLEDPGNLVLIFPQGRLYPNFVNHIHFESGIMRIIQKAQGKFQPVFAAAFVQYFKHIKPTATVYLKTKDVIYATESLTALQNDYQRHYNASKQLQTEIDIEQ